MVFVSVVLALAVAFVIAAVVVGREARRLDAAPPEPAYDRDEAVEFVANRLAPEVAAVLSHADVDRILQWNLDWFATLGVSSNGHGASPRPAGDAVVVGAAAAVDHALRRARAEGLDVTPAQLHAVLEEQLRYLEAIGAVGPEAPPDATA